MNRGGLNNTDSSMKHGLAIEMNYARVGMLGAEYAFAAGLVK